MLMCSSVDAGRGVCAHESPLLPFTGARVCSLPNNLRADLPGMEEGRYLRISIQIRR